MDEAAPKKEFDPRNARYLVMNIGAFEDHLEIATDNYFGMVTFLVRALNKVVTDLGIDDVPTEELSWILYGHLVTVEEQLMEKVTSVLDPEGRIELEKSFEAYADELCRLENQEDTLDPNKEQALERLKSDKTLETSSTEKNGGSQNE